MCKKLFEDWLESLTPEQLYDLEIEEMLENRCDYPPEAQEYDRNLTPFLKPQTENETAF